MMKVDKQSVGEYVRYTVNGWKFYIHRNHEAEVDTDLRDRPRPVAPTLMYLLQMSYFAVDNNYEIVKLHADPVNLIETYLKLKS